MNVVVLIGRLTDNPELKKTSTDISVTRFSIAVDRAYKSGEDRETDFINIVAWRQTAEFITRYFTKGQRIGVEGSLRMNKYTDKDGNNRTTYEVVVSNAHFIEPKKESGSEPATASQPETASYTSDNSDYTEIADDLPF